MNDLIFYEVADSIDDVKEEVNLGLEGYGGTAEFDKSI